MKKINYNLGFVLLFIVFIGLIHTSCDKADLLDITPTDRFSEDKVFNDEALLQAVVYDSYTNLRQMANPTIGGYDGISDIMLFNRNQPGYIYRPYAITQGFPDYIGGFTTPDNVGNLADWGEYYKAIAKVNNYFQKVTTSIIDPDKLVALNGEMRFIRAYIYFDLIRMYGGVPLITEPFDIADEESFKVAKSSYDEVASFIVSECDLASEALKDEPEVMGKISATAAKALKARMLLYMASPLNNPGNERAKWLAAETATMDVLNSGKSLGNFEEIPFKTNYQSDEIIFSRVYNPTSRIYYFSMNFLLWPSFGGLATSIIMPTQKFVDMFPMSDGKKIADAGSGYDPQKFWENRDPRFYKSIMYPGSGPHRFLYDDGSVQFRRQQHYESITDPTGANWNTEPFVNPNYPNGRGTGTITHGFSMAYNFGADGFTYADNVFWWPGRNALTRYHSMKYMDFESERISTEDDVPQMQLFFRITEFYLNMAEIKMALGEEAEAKSYLNQIRARVDMPEITSSGAELVEDYRNERAIELHLEDHRLFDILRWKIGPETVGQLSTGIVDCLMDWSNLTHQIDEPGGAFGTLSMTFGPVLNQFERNWDDKLYRFPIPAAEIERSGNLIIQNTGY